jgi:PIN domain nuclease of toxin-antitoxin system
MKNAILIGLLVFGMNAQAANICEETDKKCQINKQVEYLKKAKYFEIKAKLETKKITLAQAQKIWLKNLDKIRKIEEKEATV